MFVSPSDLFESCRVGGLGLSRRDIFCCRLVVSFLRTGEDESEVDDSPEGFHRRSSLLPDDSSELNTPTREDKLLWNFSLHGSLRSTRCALAGSSTICIITLGTSSRSSLNLPSSPFVYRLSALSNSLRKVCSAGGGRFILGFLFGVTTMMRCCRYERTGTTRDNKLDLDSSLWLYRTIQQHAVVWYHSSYHTPWDSSPSRQKLLE